jgi:uncharacterized protein YyaL (SSP411 family)
MLAARAKRIRPHLDDKILASWNGLMLGAFARAGIVLREKKYLEAAEKNLSFIRKHLWQTATGRAGSPLPAAATHGVPLSIGSLYHRWRDGERDEVQLLEGYAFYLAGVIDLYEATLKPAHLDFAIELAESLLAKFFDSANGGFWQSPADKTDLILRIKDDYDGAEPSGNSVATIVLLKLGKITGRHAFTEAGEQTLQLAAVRLQKQPAALAVMLQALDFWLDEPQRVVITGDSGTGQFLDLLHATHSVYQPNKIVLGNTGAVEPFARTLSAKEAAAFVCQGHACQLPTSEPAKLKALLG